MKYILYIVILLICANPFILGQGISVEIRNDKEFLKSLNYEKVSIEKEMDIKIPSDGACKLNCVSKNFLTIT